MESGSADDRFAVARYGPHGGLDHSFSDDGMVTTAMAANDIHESYGDGVAIDNSDRIVVGGRAYLPGSYNSNVLRLGEDALRAVKARGLEPVVYVVGKKGVGYFRFRQVPMEQDWQGFSEVPTYDKAEEIGRRLVADFGAGRIDELLCIYTDFRSAFTLRATEKRFLPIAPEEIGDDVPDEVSAEYLFEPDPAEILDVLLPQYLITKVYNALLESAASENAARRRAMKAATENAEDLIKVLSQSSSFRGSAPGMCAF